MVVLGHSSSSSQDLAEEEEMLVDTTNTEILVVATVMVVTTTTEEGVAVEGATVPRARGPVVHQSSSPLPMKLCELSIVW